jgi:hypothetical protein
MGQLIDRKVHQCEKTVGSLRFPYHRWLTQQKMGGGIGMFAEVGKSGCGAMNFPV